MNEFIQHMHTLSFWVFFVLGWLVYGFVNRLIKIHEKRNELLEKQIGQRAEEEGLITGNLLIKPEPEVVPDPEPWRMRRGKSRLVPKEPETMYFDLSKKPGK